MYTTQLLPPDGQASRRSSLTTVFCLPYAGGSAAMYHHWRLRSGVAHVFHPVELPGHGDRFSETAHQSFCTLVPALASELRISPGAPYVFFGHSMGALVAFELCRYLRRQGRPLPQELFVSACRAPHLERRDAGYPWWNAPVETFIANLRLLNGTSPQLFQSPELMETILPYLRADFRMVHQYAYTDEAPLDVPITAFCGTHDSHVLPSEVQAWASQTAGRFRYSLLPGGHFFLRHHERYLYDRITESL